MNDGPTLRGYEVNAFVSQNNDDLFRFILHNVLILWYHLCNSAILN